MYEMRLDRWINDYIDLRCENSDQVETIECLESKIILKDKALVAAREIIDNSHRLAEHGREEIKSLEGELSVCKQDSEVLKKVVEIVDMWDTYPVGKEMHKIYALVEDYLDVACEGCGKRCTLEELTDGRCHECVLPDGHQTHVYIGR
jgi:hypothetical protein